MATERISNPMKPNRVVDAIAHIGYTPEAALMDLADNAVAAEAQQVIFLIDTDADKTFASKNNVVKYRIVDDGKGMNRDEILRALQLGSDVSYAPNSVSKYGMGLKSAGFSLGSRIQVISKKNGQYSDVYYLDKEVLKEADDWTVCCDPLSEELMQEAKSLLADKNSGTIIEISKCNEMQHSSAQSIVQKLQDRLGVVYYPFLSNAQTPLSIIIKCSGKPVIQVQPVDMLFSSEAAEGFDPDTYDYKSPCIVFRKAWQLSDADDKEPAQLEVVIFPQAKMASNPNFSQEEREKIKSYKISRPNKGFFIYRNQRLIRWGDSLEIVGREHIGFRARLLLNTNHDDVLHVDVSKQNLSFPDHLLDDLGKLMRIPLSQANDAFELCAEELKKSEGDENGFNVTNQDLVEQDPDEELGNINTEQKRIRAKALVKKTEEVLKTEGENNPPSPPGPVNELPVFQKVRYSDKVMATNLWEAGRDPTDGTFVRINKNHPFYLTVLTRLGASGPERQAIEAMLWCCAVGENKAIENLTDIDEQMIQKVLQKFKSALSSTISSWCTANQNLFEND